MYRHSLVKLDIYCIEIEIFLMWQPVIEIRVDLKFRYATFF
jgi:hypothetical protein